MNLILIGFMGCGKTTLGRRLASLLDLDFVDMDEEVAIKLGLPIPEIFAKKGEDFFREQELFCAKELSGRDNLLIATGGGVVEHPKTMKYLKSAGKTVYIKVETNKLISRLEGDETRPLLKNGEDYIRALIEKRLSLYEKYSDLTIDTSRLSPQASVDKLIETLKEYK